MENSIIYLDYNATTPILPEVSLAMKPYLELNYGNPSSSHSYGKINKSAIEDARLKVSKLINCSKEDIYFTSCCTESNNWALKGTAYANKDKGNHIIISSIEHPSVIAVCDYLGTKGFDISTVNVDSNGIINLDELKSLITNKTILISIMHANNEIGSIQPIEEVSKIAHHYGITFHTDAAQSIAKVDIDVNKIQPDLLSIAGHKFYAPKGIGALYIKKDTPIEKLIHGASHENNKRAGTENVIHIVGLGKASELAKVNFQRNIHHLQKMKELLYNELKEIYPELILNCPFEKSLPNTLSVSFPGCDASELLNKTSDIAASSGSACHSDDINISPVLKAINAPIEIAKGTIRFSVGIPTSTKDIRKAVKSIAINLNSTGNIFFWG